MAAPGQTKARVCVGAVAGAFGVRGEVRLKPFTDTPEAIADYGPLFTEDGRRSFEVRLTRPIKGGYGAWLSGVKAREEAEALRGTRLYVDRNRLPEPDEDEFYHADLIGMVVETLEGEELGKVKAVFDYGAGDVLEVRHPDGRSSMLPFTRAAIPHVDLAGRRIIADPPPGTLEEES